MKFFFILVSSILLHNAVFAQWDIEYKRNQKWYFSSVLRMNILDFSNADSMQLPLVDSTPVQNLQFLANRSFINDKNGRLLFYTNGSQVYDSTFNFMLNADSITPNYNTILCYINGVTILPRPNNDSLYYIFTVSSDTPCVVLGGQYIYYSIVNMKANGGKGAVISKANLLFTGSTSSGHLMPVRHGNGRDWWIIIKDCCGNSFHRFLLKPDTILSFAPQTIGLPYIVGDSWQASVSPSGNKFAIISSTGSFQHPLTDLSIYNFNRCTGDLSDPVQYIHLRDDTIPRIFSVCFSPNEKYLYWLHSDTIFQYNLLTNTTVHVAVFDSTNIDSFYVSLGLQSQFSFAAMQLGPDGRIYIGTLVDKLHYINHPDSSGTACDVHQNAIKCPSGFSDFIFNVPSFYMQPVWGSGCDTVTAVSNVEAEEMVLLYPNPANTSLNVYLPKPVNSRVAITLYNILGQRVAFWNESLNSKQEVYLTLPNLANGLYTLRIRCEGEEYIRKLVVE